MCSKFKTERKNSWPHSFSLAIGRISSYRIIAWVYEKEREMQYRHKDLACLFFLHSLRSYSFLFLVSFPSTCLYVLVARAKHICSLSLFGPYLIIFYRHIIRSFFFVLSVYSTINTTTSSFVRLLVRQHFEKQKGQRKREQINSNRQKKERDT